MSEDIIYSNGISVELRNIKKDYYVDKQPFTAIKNLSVAFPKVGFVSILGESGSGKTTLLNIIGGLDRYTDGDLLIDGVSTKEFKDQDWDNYRNKRIGFVFQSYNLIPHLNLLQNVETPLQLAGVSASERESRAREVLEKVGLGEFVKKKPNELSGGQMQRVAIARALVNSPEIILADEPTGALDSETSAQVMDLIKEMAADRCVIMVTHNERLAQKYSDRIIVMRDGEIISDSNPISAEAETPQRAEEKIAEPEIVTTESGKKKRREKKTSMSFLTALRSSAQNVLTKKGRTALTSVACSIGIIGVALVLATSNGFSNYVSDVETSVASTVPIAISPTVVSFRTNAEDSYGKDDLYPDDDQVHIYDSSSSMFIAHQNNFTQEYIDALYAMLEDENNPAYGEVLTIMENHDSLNFHFLGSDGPDGDIVEYNQFQQAGMLSSAVSAVTSLPTTVFHEIYGDEEAMEGLYDVIYGRFPTSANEMVLVVDNYNRIDMSTMQAIGLVSSNADYDYMTDEQKLIDFADIVYEGEGDSSYKEYKCYRNSDYFMHSEPRVIEMETYDDVKLEIDTSDVTASKFTGTPSTKQMTIYDSPDPEEVFAVDQGYDAIDLKIVGVLRPNPDSMLALMPTSIAYTSDLTKMMVEDYQTGPGVSLAQAQLENWYLPRSSGEDSDVVDGLQQLNEALATLIALAGESDDLTSAFNSSTINDLFGSALTYIRAYGDFTEDGTVYTYSSHPSSYLSWCGSLGSEFHAIPLDDLTDSSGITQLFLSLASGDFFLQESDPNIVDVLAAANSYSTISSILIFPKTLVGKPIITDYLDSLNEGKTDADQIIYSDVMSDFTDTIATMIDVISAVLIVFASISLVVSSVMTSIITYVSVVERTKEIGVLRACGARKRDVGRLFEAECVLIGAVAGLIGILMTLLLCIPINLIIDSLFPGNGLGSIASLAWWHAIILIALAVLLAFLSGFVPSRIAAKRDPVTCLRAE